ncbi:MAG TPA: TetR/AcrR family transcriptional regulator [Puia sp.]|nr:TetR/AcrR family transcriptional regulator [Puia sp.]
MGITDRKIRQKEEVRASILDSAWEMVITDGWPSLSIRKIADAIEYSVPVIYSHFENKDAILLEFNRKGFALLIKKMQEAKTGKANPGEEIFAMGHAYWSFAFLNREYYQLMFGLGIPTCETARRIPEMADFNAAITDSIRALTPPDKQSSIDPFLKFQSFWSMMHGLVSINMLNKATAGDYNAAEKAKEAKEDHEAYAVNRPIKNEHNGLAEQVLNDVICSFIKGIVS